VLDEEFAAGGGLNSVADGLAVEGAEGEGTEDEHIQGTLDEFEPVS
jgi:hypothetical protein